VKTVEDTTHKYEELALQSCVDDVRGEYIALKFRSYIERGYSSKI
jgi:hypothetical protein